MNRFRLRLFLLVALLAGLPFFVACGDPTPISTSDNVATQAAIAAATVGAASQMTKPPTATPAITITPKVATTTTALSAAVTTDTKTAAPMSTGLDDKGQPRACNPPPANALPTVAAVTANANTIIVKGSDTMINLGEHWARDYMARNGGKQVIVFGGGSQTGIDALIAKQTDIAESSRKIKTDEIAKAKSNGVNPVETIVAQDGVAVVVNPANPITELSITQLSDIYAGKITNWKEVGGADQPITVLSRNGESGTNQYFKERVVQKGDSKAAIYWGSNVVCLPSSQDEQDQVASKQWAIGYFGLGYVRPNVKALKIKKDEASTAISPTVENIQTKSYPISRDLYFYTNGEPQGLVKTYIEFVLSADGQKIVEQEEFVAIPKK